MGALFTRPSSQVYLFTFSGKATETLLQVLHADAPTTCLQLRDGEKFRSVFSKQRNTLNLPAFSPHCTFKYVMHAAVNTDF